MDEDGPPVNFSAEALETRYKREGLDLQFICEPFLEAAELGDRASLPRRLAGLSSEERRSLCRAVDQQGRTGLLLAAGHGDPEVAAALLDAGANPNDADNSGATALHSAAGRGSGVTVELLLRCRAEPGSRDDCGETPLMWAQGSQVVELLLEARADAHSRNSYGQTALMLACRRGDVAGVGALVRVPGTDLGAEDNCGLTAHAAATEAGHTDVTELLESLAATASKTENCHHPALVLLREEALHGAARRGDAAACAALLREGCLTVDAELGGETALLLAAGAGAGATVEALLQARADPNRADAFLKETPLSRAVLAGGSCELLWLLLEAKADPLQADLAGRTPGDVAAAWGHGQASEVLRAAAEGRLDLGGMD